MTLGLPGLSCIETENKKMYPRSSGVAYGLAVHLSLLGDQMWRCQTTLGQHIAVEVCVGMNRQGNPGSGSSCLIPMFSHKCNTLP